MSNIQLSRSENWWKIDKNTELNEGMVVKGYTYFPGDFRPINKEDKSYAQKHYYGMPKLRVGIIVEKYSNMYMKVQFRNSKAKEEYLDKRGVNLVNQFEIYNNRTHKKICDMVGRDSYCMIVRRDTLFKYFRKGTALNIDKEEIRNKHSAEKKRVEKRYFLNGTINGFKREKVSLILKKWQFTKAEISISSEQAWEKASCILKRHSSKNISCIPKELKKIHKLYLEFGKNSSFDWDETEIKNIEVSMSKEWIFINEQHKLSEAYMIEYLEKNTFIEKDKVINLVKTFNIWNNSEKIASTRKNKKLIDEVEIIEENIK